MKKYSVDDFNGQITPRDTIADAIDKKIDLIKDFCFLEKNDEREGIVRSILSVCKTERELDIALHDVVRFNETIEEFIARKEKENA